MIFARTRLRLMLFNVAVMTAVIGLLGTGVVVLMDRVLVAEEARALDAEAERAGMEMREGDEGEFQAQHQTYATGTFYVLWDAAGDPVFNPAAAPTAPLGAGVRMGLAGRPDVRVVHVANQDDLLVATRPVYDRSRLTGVIQAGRSLAPVHAVEAEAAAVVAVACLLALLAGVAGSWFLAGRALVPIRQALDRQREFTADASHELRTPLSLVDAGIQVLRRRPEQTIAENEDVLQTISDESRRMGRLVANLLMLARADSGEAELQPADVDVDELVRAAAASMGAAEPDGRPRVHVVRSACGTARVDGDRMRQLVLILVDNALRHAGNGRPVEVSCTRQDRELVLEVADHGPGIPPRLRERVFERFYRADESRTGPGTGLGLPIARWIAAAHGGTISLHDNRPGLRVRVALPVQR